MPQVAKVGLHGAVDKIFAHTVPIEVGSFELLSLGTLKLVGSVGNSGKSSCSRACCGVSGNLGGYVVSKLAKWLPTSFPPEKTSRPHLAVDLLTDPGYY